jgi:hypothetical protein
MPIIQAVKNIVLFPTWPLKNVATSSSNEKEKN